MDVSGEKDVITFEGVILHTLHCIMGRISGHLQREGEAVGKGGRNPVTREAVAGRPTDRPASGPAGFPLLAWATKVCQGRCGTRGR